jgi:hypothetical protein
MLPRMFVVTEAEAAAIRAVFQQRGEFAAAFELRQLFPGITDNAQARECARTIAGWKPLPNRRGYAVRHRPAARIGRNAQHDGPNPATARRVRAGVGLADGWLRGPFIARLTGFAQGLETAAALEPVAQAFTHSDAVART